MTIYLDEIFFWNTASDLFLMAAVQRLLGSSICWKRTWWAALAGGIYGVLCVLPRCRWLSGFLPLLLMGFLLNYIVFRRETTILRYWLLTLVTACAMAGAVGAVGGVEEMRGSLLLFLTAFAGCYILLSAVFPGAAEGLADRSQLLRVELTHRGRRVSFLCLRDTGNSLTDPTSGQPVMVVWQQTLLPVAEYLDSEELYFLRYQSLGNPDGRLLCFRAEQVVIEGTVCRDLPVAIAGTPLSDGRSYTALWNGKESGNGLEQAERTSI